MKLKLHEIELFMNDADETRKFYSETLAFMNLMDEDGLKVWDSGYPGLDFTYSTHFPNKTSISFLTDDLEAYVKQLRDNGLDVKDPEDAHIGMRAVSFEDPNGIRVEIQEPTDKSPLWLKDMLK